MFGIIAEKRLTLTKLAQREGVNTSTVWRWAQKGVRSIRLETFCVGGRRFTSEEAFARFVELTTAAAESERSVSSVRRQDEEETQGVEEGLDDLGI